MAAELPGIHLWPEPVAIRRSGDEQVELPDLVALSPSFLAEAKGSREQFERGLREHGFGISHSSPPPRALPVRAERVPGKGHGEEGYELLLSGQGVQLEAETEAGWRHGISTLLQLLRGGPSSRLPALQIRDAPRLRQRGVMIDVSRDKVPDTTTLHDLVDRLAGWKINQLQLYFEHAFAYRGHEVVWREASPFTAAEVRELDAFCAARGIELVPNQNSFGHFHRWLVHEPYRRLAECPEGIEHPFSSEVEPFSLCPVDEGCLELLADLYDQLLPNFRSQRLNVGLDETFDLGRGRSAEACSQRGRGRVYLEFLRSVHSLAAERGHRIQIWADILLNHPELLPEVPRDAEALIWGYEADHDFDEACRRVASSGLDFLVCPGTSSWNSFGGRLPNALANLQGALRAARDHGAQGCLVTDWGDFGHLQPWPISEAGLCLGAGLAWNPVDLGLDSLPSLLDRHLFDGVGFGNVARHLGEIYLSVPGRNRNGSTLFHLLIHQRDPRTIEGFDCDGLVAARERLLAAREELATASSGRPDAELLRRELAWVSDILRIACEVGRARCRHPVDRLGELPPAIRSEIAGALSSALAERRGLWLERNRPGGLRDALERLARPLRELKGFQSG